MQHYTRSAFLIRSFKIIHSR